MIRILVGIVLVVAANVFTYIPEGPTLFSLPFTWIGIGLVIYGASSLKGDRAAR